MPFTIYHFGPAIFIFSLFVVLDPVALLIGSIIPDIEGIFALYILPQSDLHLHGPFHSFLGAFILSSLIGFGSVLLWTLVLKTKWITSFSPNFSFFKSFISALIGAFSHVLLDSFLYPEMNPFFPVEGNPFLNIIPDSTILFLCICSFILGVLILLIRFSIQKEVFQDFRNYSRGSICVFFSIILILTIFSFFAPFGMLIFFLLILVSFILIIIKYVLKDKRTLTTNL